jgi:hypothetical protein
MLIDPGANVVLSVFSPSTQDEIMENLDGGFVAAENVLALVQERYTTVKALMGIVAPEWRDALLERARPIEGKSRRSAGDIMKGIRKLLADKCLCASVGL